MNVVFFYYIMTSVNDVSEVIITCRDLSIFLKKNYATHKFNAWSHWILNQINS